MEESGADERGVYELSAEESGVEEMKLFVDFEQNPNSPAPAKDHQGGIFLMKKPLRGRAIGYSYSVSAIRFRQSGKRRLQLRAGAIVALTLAVLCAGADRTRAQVVFAGDQGGLRLSAGALGNSAYVQYGQKKMLGVSGFIDADTKRRIGIEAEGCWLEFHQTGNVHAETYSIGGRYHFNLGRFEPYAKGLAGFGDFNFPYNLATGRYLVVTAGGGVDFHWRHRIYLRAADLEYQDWPQFTFGSMAIVNVSAGIRVRVY